jgi:hypothetical protein
MSVTQKIHANNRPGAIALVPLKVARPISRQTRVEQHVETMVGIVQHRDHRNWRCLSLAS